MAKIKAISRQIDALVARHLSEKAQQALIADLARTKIKEADDQNKDVLGVRVPYDISVDGRPDAPLTSVKPHGGVILAKWQMVNEAVTYVWELLRDHPPRRSGRYQDSHTLFADEREVTDPSPNLIAREWVFMSSVPYARKIEGGPHRPPQSDEAPEGVYETVAEMANQRFSNVADIRFTFMDWIGGKSMFTDWLSGKEYPALGAAAARRQYLKDARQPAIVITNK